MTGQTQLGRTRALSMMAGGMMIAADGGIRFSCKRGCRGTGRNRPANPKGKEKQTWAFQWAALLSAVVVLQQAHGAHSLPWRFWSTTLPEPDIPIQPQGQPAGSVVWGCSSLNRGVALTFDDGPSPETTVLLDQLKALNIKATFFVCGANVRLFPEIVKRAFDEGHEIGLHTWNHANLTHLWANEDAGGLHHELWDTEAEVMAVTGVKPRLFRPPYGAVTPGLVQLLGSRGYTTVMWNGGCIDWWLNNMTTAIPYMLNGMADSGSLLCLHDSYPSTCEGVTELVNMLATAEPQTTVNPQGRRMLSWDECVPSSDTKPNRLPQK